MGDIMCTRISSKGQIISKKPTREIIIGFLIFVCWVFIIGEMTESAKAETDPERFVCLKTITRHSHDVNCIAFSQNNQWLASSSNDNTIKIWNTSDWSCIKTLTGHSDDVKSVVFSENNKWLASGSDDKTIKIWNTSNWSRIKTLTGHSGRVESVDFSENNEWLASGSSDNTIKIWNTSDWSKIKTLTGHSSTVNSVDFSENNEWLVSVSWDKTIKIWNTSDWSCIKTFTGHSISVECVDFSENNKWLASGSNKEIKIWDTSDWSKIKTLTGHPDWVRSVDFSENNEWLASGSDDKKIKIWNTSDWSCIKTLTGHSDNVWSVDFSENNECLASGSWDNRIKIWENLPDLTLTSSDISFSKENIISGEKVTIYAEIENIGLANATNVVMNFYYDEDYIGNDTINFLAGKTENASVEWKVPFTLGNHIIHVIIDEENKIFEENENNNNPSINITILPRFLPNIYVKNKTKTANPNQVVNYKINVKNNGYKFDSIYLSFSTTKSWQYNLNKTAFFLNPQKSANATLIVIPSLDAKAGDFAEITITATSNGNSTRQYSITVKTTVNQTHSISLDLIGDYSKTVNPGETVEYQIKIINNGNGDDTINLELSGKNSDWGKLENSQINLTQNEIKTVNLKITVPNNAKSDETAKITISAYSGDKFLNSIETKTLVNQIYDIKIETDKNQLEIKPEQSVEYKIKVTNNGNGNDTVRLEKFGINSNWGWLEKSIIALNFNQSKDIILTLKSSKNTVNDEKAIINIQAISKNGETSNFLIVTTTVKIPENIEPTAVFKILYKNKEVEKVRIGEIITFDATGSFDEDGNITKYKWIFENGEIYYRESFNYAFPENIKTGEHTIILKITDNDGDIVEKEVKIEILEEEEEKSIVENFEKPIIFK